jgi:thiamine-phosphate diphosphorylase
MAADNERPEYLGVGPVWATPSKPGARAMGLETLREICESVGTPVVAIGGIDATNAALCLEAGAVGVAVVRASTSVTAVRTALERAAV